MKNESDDDKKLIKYLKDEVAFLRTAFHSMKLRGVDLLNFEKTQILNADGARVEIEKIEGMKK